MDQHWKRMVALGNPEAQEIFDILYPKGNTEGNEKTRRTALKRLVELARELGQYQQVMPLTTGYSGKYENGQYVMLWSYPHKWVTLYKSAPLVKELVGS